MAAPMMVASGADGQIRDGAWMHGLYDADRRILSRLVLTVDGAEPEPLRGHLVGVVGARFTAVVRTLGENRPDPALVVDRRRTVPEAPRTPARMTERLVLRNAGRVPLAFEVTLSAAADLADIAEVKAGRAATPQAAVATGHGLAWEWRAGRVELTADRAPDTSEVDAGRLHWSVTLAPGDHWQVTLTVAAASGDRDQAHIRSGGHGDPPWARPEVDCDDRRLAELVERSLADLTGLLLADPYEPSDRFLAAGAPWYLTLFGRDTLWAARMLLPLGTELAAGTLRTLARRQGVRYDRATEEQPGKILHELRGADDTPSTTPRLPPSYYGTVDATLLFVSLLAEAHRWGLADTKVAALLPHAERALAWLRDQR